MSRPRTVPAYLIDLAFPLSFVGAAIFGFVHEWEKAVGFLLWGVLIAPVWAFLRWRGGRGWRVIP